MREKRESLSFLSFLPRRERPLLAGNRIVCGRLYARVDCMVIMTVKG